MGVFSVPTLEFRQPILPSPTLSLTFLVLTILSLGALLIPLTLALFSRDTSHPVLVNFLACYFFYVLVGGLVVFSQAGRVERLPSYTLCLVQGTLMMGGTTSISLAAATFLTFLYATLQTSSKRLSSFVRSRTGTVLLVAIPWICWASVSVAALIYGLRTREKVLLRDLYCIVYGEVGVVRFIGGLLFLSLALLSAVAISVLVIRNHRLERLRRHLLRDPSSSDENTSKAPSLRSEYVVLVEAWGLTAFFLTIALLLSKSLKIHRSYPADMFASIGGILTLLLGNQFGLYNRSTWQTVFSSFRTTLEYLRERLDEHRHRAPPPTPTTPRTLLPLVTTATTTSRVTMTPSTPIGFAISTSTLESDPNGEGSSAGQLVETRSWILLSSGRLDDEEMASSSVLGEDDDEEKGGAGMDIEEVGASKKKGRKKRLKIKVEVLALNELGAKPLPEGKRVYQ